MILEMERGFSGACPYVDLADVFASAFNLWHAGRSGRRSTCSEGSRRSPVSRRSLGRHHDRPRSVQTRTRLRTAAPAAGAAGGAVVVVVPLRQAARDTVVNRGIRKELDAYLKPYLKA